MVAQRNDRSLAVVGAFIALSVVSFTLLFVAATSRSLAERRTDLWIELPTAEGLRKGDAVLFRGVQVGEVRRIDFAVSGSVLVRAVLTRRVPLTTSASARLVAADVFGRQTVVLEGGPHGAAPLAGGDTLRGVPPTSLTGRIEGMASRLERAVGDTTVDGVHALLREAAVAARSLEAALETTRQTITTQRPALAATLSDGAGVAANLRAATDSVALIAMRESTYATLQRLERIAWRADSTSQAVAQVLGRVERGEGSIGLLTADPALYQRAVATLDSFEQLLNDVRRNPKRYINVSVF